eukprot:CAMPEP_0174373112 /NCGR_PEP_ID=MMETSP0811_2-20130205/105842_1 /TAXON_ID=73025 ORGANISM="Eutreptiella gymnastica-like, Strain CCMP1594" /NCGR_SAMPLE_ID=MMETSP0811_2 /ASSEMBLY_ACC=CAM_ASM_000667 /LENGTH=60 /DNA_ID=CAMNT_0015521105 /DNA_START=322 /DNA_END=501 /DNA_ORIENTATION=-
MVPLTRSTAWPKQWHTSTVGLQWGVYSAEEFSMDEGFHDSNARCQGPGPANSWPRGGARG